MDPKKLALPVHLLLPRRKHVSGFGLWVGGASFILLSVILLSNSLKGRLVTPLLQGFNTASVTLNSSLVSWPLPLRTSYFPTPVRNDGNGSRNGGSSSSNSSGSGSGSASARDDEVYKASGATVVGVTLGKTETHLGNSTGRVEDGGFGGNLEDLRDTHLDDLRVTVENGSLPGDGERGAVVANYSVSGNEIMDVKGSKGGEFVQNASLVNSTLAENSNHGNLSNNGDMDSRSPAGKEERVDENQQVTSSEECDMFDGRWVRDDSKPYYPAGSCPHIDSVSDCRLNGRPDDGYLKWKWQPNDCDIPSLNATDFLERLRGKKLVFVGDSLNRNMWESLVCILRHSIKDKRRVYEISGRTEFKKKGFYAFRFQDYNCTVDFVASPFLVRESTFKSKNGTIETLRLDLMDKTTSMYHDADIIVFNTGHWWTHEKTSRGEDYYQEGNIVHPRLKVLKAYKRALQTWARWLEKNIDTNRTQVFFRGYSVTHFRGGQWNSGGQCHKETEPIVNTSYLAKYPSKMRVLELVLKETSTPVTYLNISRLTDYRKDGHPSIYRMQYKTSEERIAAERSQDCSHWCLPGVPDVWNELLYASLLKAGKGSWRI